MLLLNSLVPRTDPNEPDSHRGGLLRSAPRTLRCGLDRAALNQPRPFPNRSIPLARCSTEQTQHAGKKIPSELESAMANSAMCNKKTLSPKEENIKLELARVAALEQIASCPEIHPSARFRLQTPGPRVRRLHGQMSRSASFGA